MATGYKAFTTQDGAWLYGYAEYNKKLSDATGYSTQSTVAKFAASYPKLTKVYNFGAWLTGSRTLGELAQAADAKVKNVEPGVVPTYYIFAKAIGKDVKIRLAGEWYFDASKRDAVFEKFKANFDSSGLSDALRVVLISQYASMKDYFSLDTLEKNVKNAAITKLEQAQNYPPPVASSTPFVILTIAGIGFIVYLLRR